MLDPDGMVYSVQGKIISLLINGHTLFRVVIKEREKALSFKLYRVNKLCFSSCDKFDVSYHVLNFPLIRKKVL